MAREFAAGLKVLLDSRPDIQILWKLKTSGGLALQDNKTANSKTDSGFHSEAFEKGSLDAISTELAAGRVKVQEWLSVDPLAVLQSGHVVCSVHHGGSNSFHEALRYSHSIPFHPKHLTKTNNFSAGVPQIVLPCWLDTFEFANRVEYLGIGIYGSRTSAPGVEAGELSRALMRVLGGGEESVRMKGMAAELREISGRVGGRKRACEKIVELLEHA